jgi:hypothetical protein
LKDNVIHRQNACKGSVAADDRKSPDPAFAHCFECSADLLLGPTEMTGRKTQVGYPQLIYRFVMGPGCNTHVPVGDHTDKLAGFIHHGKCSAIGFEHNDRDLS